MGFAVPSCGRNVHPPPTAPGLALVNRIGADVPYARSEQKLEELVHGFLCLLLFFLCLENVVSHLGAIPSAWVLE